MNLRDLEYLVALEEEKHFRKAAERCFVSQPTLSGQLRKLEDELGVILIERTSRKVLFTPAGDAMAQQARKVLKEVRELKSIGQHFAEPMSGEIHIGFIPTVGPYLLPHIIQDLREHFPKLEFYLYEEQTQVLLKRLEEGELDCLILAELEGMDGFGSIPLYQEPMWLAVPQQHPEAKAKAVPLSNLKGKKLLMLADGHCLRDQAMGFCFAAGRRGSALQGHQFGDVAQHGGRRQRHDAGTQARRACQCRRGRRQLSTCDRPRAWTYHSAALSPLLGAPSLLQRVGRSYLALDAEPAWLTAHLQCRDTKKKTGALRRFFYLLRWFRRYRRWRRGHQWANPHRRTPDCHPSSVSRSGSARCLP
ncbi:hypothetical protein KAM330_11630 [Aeromonas hydrophila]|nr:hypothetical protein KAM330_11630 [Aeromonas hydrophila]